jgi:hypothetical protein
MPWRIKVARFGGRLLDVRSLAIIGYFDNRTSESPASVLKCPRKLDLRRSRPTKRRVAEKVLKRLMTLPQTSILRCADIDGHDNDLTLSRIQGKGTLKAATAVNVRHILCEKHGKATEALQKIQVAFLSLISASARTNR